MLCKCLNHFTRTMMTCIAHQALNNNAIEKLGWCMFARHVLGYLDVLCATWTYCVKHLWILAFLTPWESWNDDGYRSDQIVPSPKMPILVYQVSRILRSPQNLVCWNDIAMRLESFERYYRINLNDATLSSRLFIRSNLHQIRTFCVLEELKASVK